MILNEDFIPWNINIACIIINTALCQCFPWLGWNVFLFFPPLSIRNNMYTDWIEIGFISRNHTIWIVSCWLLGLGKCMVPNINAKYFYVLCINVWHVHLHKTVGTGCTAHRIITCHPLYLISSRICYGGIVACKQVSVMKRVTYMPDCNFSKLTSFTRKDGLK